ncbi:MAG: PAS domain S-box protein [Desulfobacteraceae bacterium]|nr:PAS domain S-box protein [Desulfobacteraceae bacterium]
MENKPSYEELQRLLDDLRSENEQRRSAEAELEKEVRKFAGLYDLAVALTNERSLDEYLRLIVDKCRQLLRLDISYIALHDETKGDFYKHTLAGVQTEAFKNLRIPYGQGLGGLVAKTRQGQIVNDYMAERKADLETDRIIAEEGIVSGMAVPIQMGARNLGVLYTFNRTITAFSQSDLDTLFLIANLAAVEISRKQSEDSLRESEERFRFMAATTGDVIYRLHYDSMTYDYLSPGISNLTGYSPEEITSIGFGRLVERIDQPGKENVSPETIKEERLAGKTGEYRADYLISTRDGSPKWLRDHSFPWFDGTDRIAGSVGILSDVTDYKRAESLLRQRTNELMESEAKYRTLVENVPLVVYRTKPTGEVLFVNQFVEELIGYGPVEILRDPGLWDGAIYDPDREKVMELRRKARLEGKEYMFEYRIMHKNNYLVHVVDHAIPSQGPDCAENSVDGIIMDVTSRVKLQEKLIRSEGIKTIGEVSARLAHEIRNPLASAGGFARRLLASIGPGDPNREMVEIIVKEVGRLDSILRMILNYIKPIDLEISMTDPNELVRIALRGIEADIGRRYVSIRTQLSADLPAVPLDELQMKQVLKSLLKKALGQIQPGAELLIRSSFKDGVLLLGLEYPVPHLSRDDVEHFFYPFTSSNMDFPADLPMSKIIVHKHGGPIEVKLQRLREISILISLPGESGVPLPQP